MALSPVSAQDETCIAHQLGRTPRGLVGIAARCQCGNPTVIATAARLPDGSPFPTFYYLTHPAVVRACSVLEAEHAMADLSQWVQADPAVRDAYQRAHEAYLSDRAEFGQVAEIENVSAGGMPTRVKCLHALVGHALAAGPGVNPVGDRALDIFAQRGLFDQSRCWCEVPEAPHE